MPNTRTNAAEEQRLSSLSAKDHHSSAMRCSQQSTMPLPNPIPQLTSTISHIHMPPSPTTESNGHAPNGRRGQRAQTAPGFGRRKQQQWAAPTRPDVHPLGDGTGAGIAGTAAWTWHGPFCGAAADPGGRGCGRASACGLLPPRPYGRADGAGAGTWRVYVHTCM